MGTTSAVMEADLATLGMELNKASQILGSQKVITAEQAAKAWGVRVEQQPRVLYDEATLKQCAQENASNRANWRLIYIHGFSLRRQREIIGTDYNRQPSFYDNDWWMEPNEENWSTQKTATGYVLIDFRGRFGNKTWFEQEDLVEALGPEFRRTHEATIVEAIFTTFKVTSHRLLQDWYHWGVSQVSHGNRAYVGDFSSGRLRVDGDRPGSSDGFLQVCVSRSFQY